MSEPTAAELTRIISNTKKAAKAAPKARSRNFGWKKNEQSMQYLSKNGRRII